ncbi:MAG: polysaccharide biosynthesis/export family protein [Flavobacteriales bacterium]
MFKTSTDYRFDTIRVDSSSKQFRILKDDMLSLRVFANDGFKMIDLVDERGDAYRTSQRVPFTYLVGADGQAKMPLIGRVHVEGLTIREAEDLMEERYAQYYNKPFVQIQVNNRRVVVFPGGGGDAKVVPLENNNTTLLEALAAAGGISKRGDARKVKLFRRDPRTGGREVYQFNMADIHGLPYADIVMQADDVVYVHPNPEIARELLNNLTPVVTLLTSIVLVVGLVNGLSK